MLTSLFTIGRFPVPISVKGYVKARVIVRLEGAKSGGKRQHRKEETYTCIALQANY
jgi:hypothetical protein